MDLGAMDPKDSATLEQLERSVNDVVRGANAITWELYNQAELKKARATDALLVRPSPPAAPPAPRSRGDARPPSPLRDERRLQWARCRRSSTRCVLWLSIVYLYWNFRLPLSPPCYYCLLVAAMTKRKHDEPAWIRILHGTNRELFTSSYSY